VNYLSRAAALTALVALVACGGTQPTVTPPPADASPPAHDEPDAGPPIAEAGADAPASPPACPPLGDSAAVDPTFTPVTLDASDASLLFLTVAGGDTYVTVDRRIRHVTASGEIDRAFAGTGELSFDGVQLGRPWIDRSGDLLVPTAADIGDVRIYRVHRDGTVDDTFGWNGVVGAPIDWFAGVVDMGDVYLSLTAIHENQSTSKSLTRISHDGRHLEGVPFSKGLQGGNVTNRMLPFGDTLFIALLGGVIPFDANGVNDEGYFDRNVVDPPAITVLSDGTILAAGGASNLMRLTRGGLFDESFGRHGTLQVDENIAALFSRCDGSALGLSFSGKVSQVSDEVVTPRGAPLTIPQGSTVAAVASDATNGKMTVAVLTAGSGAITLTRIAP
jgi:hypothetical protein